MTTHSLRLLLGALALLALRGAVAGGCQKERDHPWCHQPRTLEDTGVADWDLEEAAAYCAEHEGEGGGAWGPLECWQEYCGDGAVEVGFNDGHLQDWYWFDADGRLVGQFLCWDSAVRCRDRWVHCVLYGQVPEGCDAPLEWAEEPTESSGCGASSRDTWR